jgi:hypothetical protein
MNRRLLSFGAVLAFAALSGTPGAFAASGHGGHAGGAGTQNSARQSFVAPRLVTTTAVGSQEVGTVGDADGVANVQVVLIPSQNRACLIALARNLTLPATLVHIHSGVAGTNGPVAIDFTSVVRQNATAGVINGCVENPNVTAVAQAPANFYVNIHTSDFPKGAVRGQLA